MKLKMNVTHVESGDFAAWVQVSEGSETVSAVFGTGGGEFVPGGSVVAEHGCWSLLKGGIAANSSGLVDLLFEVKGIQLFWSIYFW